MSNTLLTLLSSERIAEFTASGHWQADTLYQIARPASCKGPALAMSRTIARAGIDRAASKLTISFPVVPVAPVSKIIFDSGFVGFGACIVFRKVDGGKSASHAGPRPSRIPTKNPSN